MKNVPFGLLWGRLVFSWMVVLGADLDKNSTWRDDGQSANQNPLNVVLDSFVFWKNSSNPDEAFRDRSVAYVISGSGLEIQLKTFNFSLETPPSGQTWYRKKKNPWKTNQLSWRSKL